MDIIDFSFRIPNIGRTRFRSAIWFCTQAWHNQVRIAVGAEDALKLSFEYEPVNWFLENCLRGRLGDLLCLSVGQCIVRYQKQPSQNVGGDLIKHRPPRLMTQIQNQYGRAFIPELQLRINATVSDQCRLS